MKKIKVFLLLFLTLCLSSPLTSLAEGMFVTGSDGRNEAAYCYALDDGPCVKNEWRQVWGNWYYFGEKGVSKQNTWAEIGGNWYYFNEWSVMLANTTTPDGYYVNSNGAWIAETNNGNTAIQDNKVETNQEAPETVYVSATGSKYHYDANCGNMTTARPISIEQARERYQACSNCVH